MNTTPKFFWLLSLLLGASAQFAPGAEPPAKPRPGGLGARIEDFQSPFVDGQGRRSVLKGDDARHAGDNVYEISKPNVVSYDDEGKPMLMIEAPRCRLDRRTNQAESDSELAVRTADDRFAIQGLGWRWNPSSSRLVISNNVSALILKSALDQPAQAPNAATPDEAQKVRVTSREFFYLGDLAIFKGDVRVVDGEATVACGDLRVALFEKTGVRLIHARENVELTQKEGHARAQEAVYDLASSVLTLTNQVSWDFALRTGSSDLLVLERTNGWMRAEGSVHMRLPYQDPTVPTNAPPAATPKEATPTFFDIYSDRFRYLKGATNGPPGEALFEGNVRGKQDTKQIACEELEIVFGGPEDKPSRLLAKRGVRLSVEENHVWADLADYSVAEERIVLTGNPRFDLEKRTGTSDSIILLPRSHEALALGRVRILVPQSTAPPLQAGAATNGPMAAGLRGDLRVEADLFSHKSPVSVFTDNVRVADEKGTIECRNLVLYAGENRSMERILATGGVVITQDELRATGQRADYSFEEGLVQLTGQPRITTPGRELTADAFLINRAKGTFQIVGNYQISLEMKSSAGKAAKGPGRLFPGP